MTGVSPHLKWQLRGVRDLAAIAGLVVLFYAVASAIIGGLGILPGVFPGERIKRVEDTLAVHGRVLQVHSNALDSLRLLPTQIEELKAADQTLLARQDTATAERKLQLYMSCVLVRRSVPELEPAECGRVLTNYRRGGP